MPLNDETTFEYTLIKVKKCLEDAYNIIPDRDSPGMRRILYSLAESTEWLLNAVKLLGEKGKIK